MAVQGCLCPPPWKEARGYVRSLYYYRDFCISPVYGIVKTGQSGSELEPEPEAENGTEASGSVRGFLDVMRKAAGLYSYYRVQSTECC